MSLGAMVLMAACATISFRSSVWFGTYYAGFVVASLATIAAYYVYRRLKGRPGAEYLPLIAVLPCAAFALIWLGAALTGRVPPTGL